MNRIIFLLVFVLISFSQILSQQVIDSSRFTDVPGPDTLYFPYRNGEQLITIDYINFYESLAGQLDFDAAPLSVPRSAHAYRPLGNTYFFRDTSGQITRIFNTSLAVSDVQKMPFRPSGFITNQITHNRPHQNKLYNGNTTRMHRQNLPDGYYRIFNSDVVDNKTEDEVLANRRDIRCGLMDSLGNLVLPVDYVQIFMLDNKFFVYKKTKGWGMLNRQLDTIIPIGYREFMPKYSERGELIFVLFKVINTQGYGLLFNVKTQKTYHLDGYQNMYYIDTHNAFVIHKSKKYGLLDSKGNITIPLKYSGFKIGSDNKVIFSKGTEKREVEPLKTNLTN